MTEILVYDEIGGWGVSLQAFASQLPPEGQDVSVRVSSPGGDVFAGIAMASLLRSRNATVYIDGLAASAASLLATGAKRVVMAPGSMQMIHNPWAMVAGDQTQLTKEALVLAQITESAAQMYATKSGKSVDEIKALMDAETWLTAEEAVSMGFADAIEQGLAMAACVGIERYNYKNGAKYMDIFNRQKLTDVSAELEAVKAEVAQYRNELEKTAEEKGAAASRVAELEAEIAAKNAELQAAKAEAETAVEEAKIEGKQEAVEEILEANAPEAPSQFDEAGAAMTHTQRWEMLRKSDKKEAQKYFDKHESKILRGK